MVEFEDLVVEPRREQKPTRRRKVHFIVLVESTEELYCSKTDPADEVVSYVWLLDCISHATLLPTAGYAFASEPV